MSIVDYAIQLKALIRKELRQIFRDRELLFLLLFMPVMQITLYSFALSPEVEHLRLGVIDYSNSTTSRELIGNLVSNMVFDLKDAGANEDQLANKVKGGKLEAGMIIPPELQRHLKSGNATKVQIFLDGVDANTAGIAGGYISQILAAFNNKLQSGSQSPKSAVQPKVTYLYNSGLESRWFFVPGVLALVLNLVSTLVSSAAVVREKDTGTLEQLLMTPVSSFQILAAKVIPLSAVLMVNVLISLFVAVVFYGVPFRGNFFLFMAVSFLAIIVGISIGIALAAYSANQRQSLLTSFFINLPVIQLSGALSPIESMPQFWQDLSCLDPLRYYVTCVKAIMLKGVGFQAIWPNVVILAVFAIVFLSLSSARFRKQLA
ncbi:MAG: ABC transporter permease [Cyanobacteria bacterium TGS_CYA1]|nr:ABC transporter permease [Cyanobacteria bacterium TGS_CYA1]